jgi:hypothetical protein
MPLSPAALDLKDHDRSDCAEDAEGGDQKKWIERSQCIKHLGALEHGAASAAVIG